MSKLSTIEELYNNVKDNKISKIEASKILESLINDSDNEYVRTKAIDIIRDLSLRNERVFKLLEKSIISDESPLVRYAAASTLILNFHETAKEPLIWAIQNEKSIYFFKKILDLLESEASSQMEKIKLMVIEKLKKLYKLNYEDLKFILDIDFQEYLRFKKEFNDFLEKFNIAEKHKNNLLRENTEIGYKGLGHVKASKAGYITELSLADLDVIPESIHLLPKLTRLEITRCKLKEVPNKPPDLSNLKYFKFNDNELEKIPDWVNEIAHKERFNQRYKEEGVNPFEAPALTLLGFLTGKDMIKVRSFTEITWNYAQYYKVNREGYIIGILIEYPEYPRIGIFPDLLCSIKYLEELYLVNQNIKKIPECIGQLKSLKILDLRFNKIEVIPDSIQNLNNLEYFDLQNTEGENKINYLPKSIKNLKRLKVFDLRGNVINKFPKSLEKFKAIKK